MLYYANFKSKLQHSIQYSSHAGPSSLTGNLTRLLNNHLLSRFTYNIPPPPIHGESQHHPWKHIVDTHGMESQYLPNITNYTPRFFGESNVSIWHRLPVVRRSAVLVLLFLGKSGELRVVLTKRSRDLRSFSGHVSLPGGRADTGLESEWMVARRETEEEIGISRYDRVNAENGFSIEYVNMLPSYLSRTFLAVRPCVGFVKWAPEKLANPEDQHISSILLNPGESSSIFSVPLKDFLQPKPRRYELQECLKQSYVKTKWGGLPWNLRSYIFPLHNDNEVRWLSEVQDLSSEEEESQTDMELGEKTRDVWGLTANILRDLAEVAYCQRGDDLVIGEEELMHSLHEHGGQMSTKRRSDFETKMIAGAKGVKFGDVLEKKEFERLKKIYSHI
ncbi:unnamed protein product [Kuraishia capsulata CBS 1993]|uniref:Nudix hydrolase domain-containing protein n=1 Tax=Kuraishia capsulata CBS 1993 TaxID=1382522 RepID=W6MSZ7_9ASCO|nr:uncharacterized protein KUCA_T00004324001 [Kuraishia capsulata CBS 1993]CDK28342.1 unnamed protein product [Kuraishia capsulata CBS 1993]